ncbi:ABC transporter ATP-binding protein [bacterium]|nr:ABC transporter ATP-binding protein [bacterium]
MNNNLLIQIENLRISFFDKNILKTVVDDVDFNLQRGEILGIVGESGSGKTQTALSLLGIQSGWPGIIGGSMKYFDKDNNCKEMLVPILDGSLNKTGKIIVKDKRKWRNQSKIMYQNIRGKKVFMMFQDPKSYLNPYWNVKKHFKRILNLDGMKMEDKFIYECLERFGLEKNIAEEYPHSLSGGESQRVMIALGYACKPEVIIADEITTGLDLVNQLRVVKHLKDLKKEMDLSIILISHDLGFVSKLADKILVMYAGQGMEYGPIEKVLNEKENFKHPYTKTLIQIYSDKSTVKFIKGPPPDRYLSDKSGCRFHARCSIFKEKKLDCDKNNPADFNEIKSDSHYIRCKLYE